jgi:membrane AbrB-like protein
LSIAALLAAMVAVTVATSVWLRLVHGWTRRDALLASVPGALSQVMIVALSTHADSRAIAVVQTFRVMVLTAFLPGALALAGLAATGVAPVPVTANPLERPGELALLVGASTLAGLAAQRLRFPGGLMLGALIASALLHGSGVVTVGPPAPVLVVCFVLLGALMGLRFAGTDAALLRRLMAAACGALVVSVAVAGLAALVVSAALSLPVAGTVVAFAPGALEAMTILAFAMGLDVAFVGAHHVVRFLVISLALPVLVRFGQANSATPRKTLDQ